MEEFEKDAWNAAIFDLCQFFGKDEKMVRAFFKELRSQIKNGAEFSDVSSQMIRFMKPKGANEYFILWDHTMDVFMKVPQKELEGQARALYMRKHDMRLPGVPEAETFREIAPREHLFDMPVNLQMKFYFICDVDGNYLDAFKNVKGFYENGEVLLAISAHSYMFGGDFETAKKYAVMANKVYNFNDVSVQAYVTLLTVQIRGMKGLDPKGHTEEEIIDIFGSDNVNHNAFQRKTDKVGRNDPCPCGSGKKYKNCCGKS